MDQLESSVSKLKSYHLKKLIGLLLVAGYAAIAIGVKPAGNTEFFPFFNWSLFSQSSNPKIDNVIIFTSINGEKLEQPALFFDLKDNFNYAKRRDSRVAKAVDRWVMAELSGDKQAAKSLRAMAEANFFPEASQAEYQIARIQFDPIRRYETGAIQAKQIVAEHVKK